MSGVAVLRYQLANNANLLAVVPATRIMAGVLPINTALPAISIRQISGSELPAIRRTGDQLVVERIQITAVATTYGQQKAVMVLIKSAIQSVRAVVNTVSVDSITQDFTGPDLYDEDPVVYEQSIDYFVRYIRSN